MKSSVEYELIGDKKSSKVKICSRELILKIVLSCILVCTVVLYNVSGEIANINEKDYAATKIQYVNQRSQKYFIHTSHCIIPYVDPFTPGVRKIYKKLKPFGCGDDNTLIVPIYDVNASQYILHINKTVEKRFVNSNDTVKCCYREIVRAGSGIYADMKFNLLSCVNFHQNFMVPTHINGLIVECNSTLTNKLLQKDAFSFVQRQDQNIKFKRAIAASKPNIMIIGIDTISRINIRRTMPKTFEYLVKNRWSELEGYNKMDDNTFPNLMALLAGLNKKSAKETCKPTTIDGLNNCKFIWKNYKNASYRTAFGEDLYTHSTFNYKRRGFRKPPTDYYLHPFIMAIENTLEIKMKYRLPFCVGRRRYCEYVYDFALEFAKRCSDEPNFGLFWTNSFSHNDYKAPAMMDTKMLDYFMELEGNGILETTIVIFLSDHGARWGPLLDQPEGFIEERLPMFFIWLPGWFKSKYPVFAHALDINRHRLSSPFDIHMTLKHILSLDAPDDPELRTPPQDCASCQSIFQEIPSTRTCADAGITDHWCTCLQFQQIDKNLPDVISITNLIINEMNQYLVRKNLSSICRKITLQSIDLAEQEIKKPKGNSSSSFLDHVAIFSSPLRDHYRIKFTIIQKSAQFHATAFYIRANNSVKMETEMDVSRLNLYANDSQCTSDTEAKKYCICCQ